MAAAPRRPAVPGPGRAWAVELLAPKRAPVPWGLSAEAAVAVGGSFAIAVLAGHTGDGLLAGLGALPVAGADRGGPYRARLRRVLGSGVAVALGILVGAAVRGGGWQVVVAGATVAAVAGLISSFDAVWSLFGLNLLIYVAIAGIDPLPGPAWRTALLALSGAAFKVVVSLPGHLRRRPGPERRAVAAVFDSVASLLEGVTAADRYQRRWALTTALNVAEDAMSVLRSSLGGPERSAQQLLTTLEHSLPLARVAVHRLTTTDPPRPESVAAVRALAAAVRSGATTGPEPPDADVAEAWREAARAVTGEIDTDGRPWRPSVRATWESRLARAAGRRSLEATLRLVLCVAVAEAVASYAVGTRPYWVPLTVAVSMKPDFGSVFARAVQRAVGTAVGVVVGAAVLATVSDTRQLLPVFVVLAALLPVTLVRNYGMFVTCLTPLVLVQIDSITPAPGQLVTARLVNTLIGVGIVLVLGYAVWPSTWRPRLAADLAAAVAAVCGCIDDVAGGRPDAGPARRRAYRALSDLRTTWSQYFADPSPTGRQARLLWPAVVALERLTDEVARLTGPAPPPMPVAVELGELATALRSVVDGGVTADAVADRRGGPAALEAMWDRVGEVASALDSISREPWRPAHRLAGVLHVR